MKQELPTVPRFGMLPESEGHAGSMLTSAVVNGAALGLLFAMGAMTHHAIQVHHYEQTELILPAQEPPKPKLSEPVLPPPPKLPPTPDMAPPKLALPEPPKPEPKPLPMESKMETPVMKVARPQVVLAPQPKAALPAAAMPAQSAGVKPSTAPVHLGQSFGATPNPYATRPATIAAIGNPYGGHEGAAVAPHGVVGSTGLGNGTHAGASAGMVGRVASAGIPGATGTAAHGVAGHVGSAGIPAMQQAAAVHPNMAQPATTSVEVLSKPSVQYTAEARQMHIQGEVVLRVTFLASGRVQVLGVVHGLGHGLDEEARRVASQIRFRPAMRAGQSVDTTTTITINFQLA